jgi:hypothetical protein
VFQAARLARVESLMESSDWTMLLPQYAVSSPGLLASVAGVIVALFFVRRYPQAALLAGMAWVLLIGNYLVGPLAFIRLMRSRVELGWSADQFARYNMVVAFARTVLSAVSYILLVVAVFIGRGRAQPRSFGPHPSLRVEPE